MGRFVGIALLSFPLLVLTTMMMMGTSLAFVPMFLGKTTTTMTKLHGFTMGSSNDTTTNNNNNNNNGNASGRKDREAFWFQDFETADGEVVNPYNVLKVSRTAETAQIKQSYRNLSRRYHPDAAMQRDILPGKCNNMDDVRAEWERIKLSYEILSDKRSRMKYDRHAMVQDPGEAMRRAALDAVGKGISGVGNGLWGIGAFAFHQITNNNDNSNDDKGKKDQEDP